MANPVGEIGQLREEELAVVRVIVPPDLSGRVFEDDLDSGDLVFGGKLTPMLVWHERYPVGRGWRSGWVLSYDTDGNGNPEDYIVGLGSRLGRRSLERTFASHHWLPPLFRSGLEDSPVDAACGRRRHRRI